MPEVRESDDLGVVVFDEDDADTLLEDYGYAVENGHVVGPDGAVACSFCDEDIQAEKVGAILPGSLHLYCTDPACLADYVAEVLETS